MALTFARTTCACADCTALCKTMPAFLLPDDVRTLATRFNLSPEDFVLQHCQLGMKGWKGIIAGKPVSFKAIVPKRGEDGACHWLKDERCEIHAESPFGCRMFDTHQTEKEWTPRSLYAMREAYYSQDYARWTRMLEVKSGKA